MHYLTIPSTPIKLEGGQTVAVEDAIKALFLEPKIVEALGTFDAFDLRTKLLANIGKPCELRDQEHAVLKECATHPTVLNAAFLTSADGVAFLRGIAEAPDKKPEEPRAVHDNGYVAVQQSNAGLQGSLLNQR